ncbi:unnamed protein product [Prunus brigantina]
MTNLINGGPIKAQGGAAAPSLAGKTIVGASNCPFAQLVKVHRLSYFHFEHLSKCLCLFTFIYFYITPFT